MIFTAGLILRIIILNESTTSDVLIVDVKYSKMSAAGGISSNLAWTLSKTSFCFTLLRVFTGKIRWILWFIIGSMNTVVVLWLVLFINQCRPVAATWDHTIPGTCWPFSVAIGIGIVAGGKGNALMMNQEHIYSCSADLSLGYSALMDFLLSALPWKFIWALQMRTRERVGVCIVMSMGIL